jgi:hypothetical protein
VALFQRAAAACIQLLFVRHRNEDGFERVARLAFFEEMHLKRTPGIVWDSIWLDEARPMQKVS